MKFTSNDPVEIWKFLKEKYSNVCDNEMCWLRQKFIENDSKELDSLDNPSTDINPNN